MGIEIVKALKELHSRDIVHQDIKPTNILYSVDSEADKAYLVDFGLSQQYATPLAKQTRQKTNYFQGTLHFAAIDAHLGLQQGKKDDLESLIYTMICLIEGSLPWMLKYGLFENSDDENQKIFDSKLNVDQEMLFENVPNGICAAYKYVRQLSFNSEPDYDGINRLFNQDLSKIKLEEQIAAHNLLQATVLEIVQPQTKHNRESANELAPTIVASLPPIDTRILNALKQKNFNQ